MTEVEEMSEWERVEAEARRLVGAPVATAPSRTITAAETKKWLERLDASPNDALCDDVAWGLTKIRWPSDPSSLAGGCDETDQWWDFKAAIKAANTLNAAIPAMLSHWDGLQRAPETRGGYEAIKALDTALSLALPYIEFPFGKYERKTHRHPPKDWHTGVIVIARIFIEAMIRSGGKAPSLERKSRLVVVVNEVMRRMNYKSVTDSAISQHLIRRIDRSSGSMLPEMEKTTN